MSTIINPGDRDRVRHEVQAALQQNQPYQIEYRITTAFLLPQRPGVAL